MYPSFIIVCVLNDIIILTLVQISMFKWIIVIIILYQIFTKKSIDHKQLAI